MKEKKIKQDKKDNKRKDDHKKPHHKKHLSGVYNKKKASGNQKNKHIESTVEQLVMQAQQAEQLVAERAAEPIVEPVTETVVESVVEPAIESEAVLEQVDEAQNESVPVVEEQHVEQKAAKQPKTKAPKQPRKPMPKVLKLLIQTVLAALFVVLGAALLIGTFMFVYSPVKANNDILADQRLQNRMELSAMVADVLPGMNVDDELSDVVLRALENKKNTLRTESTAVAGEIEELRVSDSDISKLMADTGYGTIDFSQIVKDAYSTDKCLQAMNLTVGVIDHKLEQLGVAKMKQEIADMKGTTTTVTKENEQGETITETVTVGGLIPEAQAKKAELQKKYDELQGKLDELDAYLDENNGRITAMFNRLEGVPKANNVFDKMEAITAYVKENAKDNMFLQDTEEKLTSFPGESKEEDDILFIMKVESETGIRMQMVNYGQDYQHKQLSNGMILCYEAYNIPYYATYEGLKNLMAYFNDNDDFYASIHTLSIQYNPANQSIQGNMVILHYYLLDENAEYVPPVIDEEIIPGIDGIFGDATNKPSAGKQSPYTVSDVKGWLNDGMTFEEVRDKLKSEGYPATEFAWIMKEEYKAPSDMQGFLEEYGEEGVEYDLDYVMELLECDLQTLMDIYYYSDEPEDTTGSDNTPDDPEEGTTGGDNTPDDPEEGTTGGNNTPDDPEEGTTGSGNTPDDPEEGTTGGGNTPDDPEEGTTGGGNTPDDPEEDSTGGNDISGGPMAGKQSNYTADDVNRMLDRGMSLEQVRDKIVSEGYPATELAWILKEKYKTRADIEMFVIFRGDGKYTTLDDATELFQCSEKELRDIYNA